MRACRAVVDARLQIGHYRVDLFQKATTGVELTFAEAGRRDVQMG